MADASEREFGEHLLALITAALDPQESLVPMLINELSETEARQQLAASVHYIATLLVALHEDPRKAIHDIAMFVARLPDTPSA